MKSRPAALTCIKPGRDHRGMPTRADIAGVSLFEGLSPDDLDALAALARPRSFAAGQQIFAEGDPCLGFHVVTAGRVKVMKFAPDGKEQILHVWGPGEPFGEVAVFEGDAFPANADALEDTKTLFFPRQALLDAIGRRPELAMRLLAVLSRRLRRFVAQVEALTLREVPARLAAYLLVRDEEQQARGLVALDLAKGQLANLLGATPETFSRVLARMTREGLIESAGARALRIVDVDGLVDLAEGRRRLL